MAVTTYNKPSAFALAYNPLVFYAKSTQIAQPNFRYKVVITDLISTEAQTYWINADPAGFCRFDASPFTISRFSHYLPANQYGWKASNSIRKIRVNIGEYYGTTPATYTGTNYDFICWNGVEDTRDFPDFNYTNYVYNDSTPNYKYLTSPLSTFAYLDRSDYLYVLTTQAGDLKHLLVRTWNAAGAQQGFYKITSPFESSSDYREKYVCIDIGMKGLTNIPSGQVTVLSGTFPINWNNVAYYDVSETNSSAGEPTSRQIKRLTVNCTAKFPVYTVHFLKKNGAFETCHFNKRSDFTSNKSESRYSVFPYVANGVDDYSYSRGSTFSKVLSIEETTTFNLKTDMISSDLVDLYKELFTSPLIFLDEGSAKGYSQLTYVDNSYKLNKAWNEKLFNIQANFTLTSTNYRQQ